MKHIFLINSNITMLMALKTIEYEKIKLADCSFFCTRKYRIPKEFNVPEDQIVDCDFTDSLKIDLIKDCFWQTFKIFKNRRVIKKFDREIDLLTDGEPFELYIYHGRDFFAELIYTHPQCLHYSFLEEGTLAYTHQSDVDYKLSPLKSFLYTLFLKLIFRFRVKVFRWNTTYDCDKKNFRTVYCSNPAAFPYLDNKVIVGMPFSITSDFPADLQSIIVFDGGIIDPEDQKQSLQMNFEHASSLGIKKIHYKFHPGFSELQRQDYRQCFQQLGGKYGISVEELSNQICLENIAYTLQDKISMYIVCSSAGIYASLCGSKVYCTARHFIDKSPELKRFFTILPESLFKNIDFL